jgi:hypothetical protein
VARNAGDRKSAGVFGSTSQTGQIQSHLHV